MKEKIKKILFIIIGILMMLTIWTLFYLYKQGEATKQNEEVCPKLCDYAVSQDWEKCMKWCLYRE